MQNVVVPQTSVVTSTSVEVLMCLSCPLLTERPSVPAVTDTNVLLGSKNKSITAKYRRAQKTGGIIPFQEAADVMFVKILVSGPPPTQTQ